MKKIEHLGIAVHNLEISIPLYEKMLNTTCYKKERVESEQVETAFFRSGPNKIELVAPINGQGPIQKYLEKKGEGIHHVAFDVMDIYQERQRMIDDGFICLNEEPKEGADNKMVCFFHPKSTGGILIELCMERG